MSNVAESHVVRYRGLHGSLISLARKTKSGQATVEYAIVAVMLVSMVAILAIFLYTFKQHGGRVLDLVSSEYP